MSTEEVVASAPQAEEEQPKPTVSKKKVLKTVEPAVVVPEVQKKRGAIVSSPEVKPGAKVFVSRIKRLSITLYTADEGNKLRPQMVTFSGGVFRTERTDVIEALEHHPSYGGSQQAGYTDRPEGAGEPLFWQGDYPKAVKDIMDEERKYLTKDKGFYESGAQ